LAPQGSAVPALAVLADLTVVIDPGHGGFDPGMLAEEDGRRIRESDINLAVALRLRDILQRAGARVVMTRTTDTDLVRPGGRPVRQSDIKEDLARRVELARRAGADILLSLHCNSFPSSVWRGSQTFYMEDAHQGGRLLAECIQAELARATGETDRTPNGRLPWNSGSCPTHRTAGCSSTRNTSSSWPWPSSSASAATRRQRPSPAGEADRRARLRVGPPPGGGNETASARPE